MSNTSLTDTVENSAVMMRHPYCCMDTDTTFVLIVHTWQGILWKLWNMLCLDSKYSTIAMTVRIYLCLAWKSQFFHVKSYHSHAWILRGFCVDCVGKSRESRVRAGIPAFVSRVLRSVHRKKAEKEKSKMQMVFCLHRSLVTDGHVWHNNPVN